MFKLCYIVKLASFFLVKCFLESFYVFVIIVLFIKINYDGNIYSYQSHLQIQKEWIQFEKLECFSKC